jgi:limonene-1,2-epoxide hydrolase
MPKDAEPKSVASSCLAVCIVNDLVTKTPPATIPTAGWYKVRDRRIASIRAFFDARPLTAPG